MTGNGIWADSEDCSGADPLGIVYADDLRTVVESGLFDAGWYLEDNPDVVAGDIDAIEHFLTRGWREGRRPNRYFDTSWYLQENPDVARTGKNPLRHYIVTGEAEMRAPSPFFDIAWYATQHRAEAGRTLLAHYLRHRTGGAVSPLPEFSAAFYLASYHDVAAAKVDPFEHYLLYGFREGRDPSAEFDTKLVRAMKKAERALLRLQKGKPKMNFYSQHGEDRWIADHVFHHEPAQGLMVEVGVGRWRQFSNSLHFEERGWETILIEPNPHLHPEIRAHRSGRLFTCAAGAYDGICSFLLCNEPTVSGILRMDGQRVELPIRTLTAILDEATANYRPHYSALFPHAAGQPLPIDVLSIDTEGTEMEVWRGLDLARYAPRVVVIEFSTIGLPEDPMTVIRRMLVDGYNLRRIAGGNLIFVQNGFSL